MVLISSLILIIKKLLFLGIGIFGIGFLIGLHELGHFLFCKLFNVKTPSFSIGFGPHIWKKKIGETVFSLSAIPLGGYVEIAGSEEVGQGEQKEAKRADNRSLRVKPYWQKMLILFGGIILNLIFAYTVMIIIFMLGAPKTPILYPLNATTTIETVKPGSPAETAGLKTGDQITSIDGTIVTNHQELILALESQAETKTTLTIERDGRKRNKQITPEAGVRDGKEVGTLGVAFALVELPSRPIGQALMDGIHATNQLISNVFGAIKGLFHQRNMNGVGGPVMIISTTIQGAQKGLKVFLILLAFISANLAVMNLLPLPILDGGQALLYTIEAIVGRRLPEKIKMYIHYTCWYGFLALILYLTYKDIGRIICSVFGG